MGTFLGWVALVAALIFVLGLVAMVVVAGLQIFKAAITGAIALFRTAPVKGKHTGGRHSAHVPVEGDAVKDIEGWEAEKVDDETGEVLSFVWRGDRK